MVRKRACPRQVKASKETASLGKDWFTANGSDLKARSDEQWVSVYTKHGREFHIAALSHNLGAAFYLPLTASSSGKIKTLMPAYLFCRLSPEKARILRSSAWTRSVVSAPDQKNLLVYLRNMKETLSALLSGYKCFQEGKKHTIVQPFSAGDPVKITEGLFAGAEGTIVSDSEHRNLVVRISSLGSPIEANVSRDQVRIRHGYTQPPPESEEEGSSLTAAQLIALIKPINAELVSYFAKHPDALHQLGPYRFEVLIAEILADMGYEVSLTPRSRDGGRDLLAVLPIPTGKILTVVECKRFAKTKRVGVALVERLLWIAEQYDKASCAMLATTSSFTRGAKKIEKDYSWKLQLKDYDAIHEWLQKYGTWKTNRHSGLWLPSRCTEDIL